MENKTNDLVFKLEDRPSPGTALLAAFQHLLAIFVGIITPTIVICGVLGLNQEMPYLIGMSLIVSGIATFIQVRKFGPIGSGLLSIQGTSFAFLGPILGAGFAVKAQGGGASVILATIFTACFFGSFIEMILSRFIHSLKKVITPLVSGIVVTLIGLSLIQVGITDMAGGQYVKTHFPDQFASMESLGLALLTLVTVIIFNRSKKPMLRMASICIGLVVGYLVALFTVGIDFSPIAKLSYFNVPIPFKYGFNFNLSAFLTIGLIYVITLIESTGDLTATSMVSGEPVEGDLYLKRIGDGVLGDGFNSALASVFNTFPNTTFSQNNGVIQLTGIASRYVGLYIAGLLVLLGLFPVIGGVFQVMPKPVLGGATIIMFGTVASSGVRIIAEHGLDRRGVMILALSLGLGLGVQMVPEVMNHFPTVIKSIFSSPITTGGVTAIIANLALPTHNNNKKETDV